MAYANEYNPNTPGSGSAIGATTLKQDRPESELESIANRIHRLANEMEGVGGKLGEHADRTHGSNPPPSEPNTATPCRAGQLGSLHDALDRLERIHGYVAEQAARNCTLA